MEGRKEGWVEGERDEGRKEEREGGGGVKGLSEGLREE